jgi:septum formation protein
MAASKTEAVARERSERWVLGADTIVEIDGRILGKAAGPKEATDMLRGLAGRSHRVFTGFALRGPTGHTDRIVTTEVIMRTVCDSEIAEYVAAGEWRGKAGAYAVQGMAAALVSEVRGSITNVIGLPLAEVLDELGKLGAGKPRYTRGAAI